MFKILDERKQAKLQLLKDTNQITVGKIKKKKI